MGLSCYCGDYDPQPGDHMWEGAEDYAPLDTKRGRRCCSCRDMIPIGALACRVPRFKVPYTDVECRIYGEDGEVPLASHYLCERCADLYWSLEELGFCVSPVEDQRELVRDYATDYGPAALRGEEPTES